MTDLSSYSFQKLGEDGECIVSRGTEKGNTTSVLLVEVAVDHPSKSTIDRIRNWYSLADQLESTWALRPLVLLDRRGNPALLLNDPGGTFLDVAVRRSTSFAERLRLAVACARALGRLHSQRLIHRDLKPANILVNIPTGEAWLTGFGLT